MDQHLDRLTDLLAGSPCGEQAQAELEVLCRKLTPLERDVLTGQSSRWLDPRLGADLLYLLGTTAEFEDMQLGFRRPVSSLPELVERVRLAQRFLGTDAARCQALREGKLEVPGGQEELLPEYQETVKRFVETASRLERKVALFQVQDDEGFLEIHQRLQNGQPGLDEAPTGKRRPEPGLDLAAWETESFFHLRLRKSTQGPGPAAERWCRVWIGALAARRLWAIERLRREDADEAAIEGTVEAVVATLETAAMVADMAGDRLPSELLAALDRSRLRLAETVRALLVPICKGLLGLATLDGTVEKLDAIIEPLRQQLEPQDRSLDQEPHLPQPTTRPNEPKPARMKVDYASRDRRWAWLRPMALVMFIMGGLVVIWKLDISAAVNVAYQSRGRLRAVATVMESGYLVRTSTGSSMVAKVSRDWDRLERLQRLRVVSGLLAAYRKDKVDEVLLRNLDGQLVARWAGGQLQLLD